MEFYERTSTTEKPFFKEIVPEMGMDSTMPLPADEYS